MLVFRSIQLPAVILSLPSWGFCFIFFVWNYFYTGMKTTFQHGNNTKMLQHIQSNNKNNREVTYDNRGQAESVSGTGDYLFVFYFVCYLSEGITINNYFPKTLFHLEHSIKNPWAAHFFTSFCWGFRLFFELIFCHELEVWFVVVAKNFNTIMAQIAFSLFHTNTQPPHAHTLTQEHSCLAPF